MTDTYRKTLREERHTALKEYGFRLVAAGFKVWFHDFSDGYLTYEKDGYAGSFQGDHFGHYQHLMPLYPSKEHGSSMFIGHPVEDVWSVEAAAQCAQPENWNEVVGTRRNLYATPEAKRPAYFKMYGSKGVPMHKAPDIVAAVLALHRPEDFPNRSLFVKESPLSTTRRVCRECGGNNDEYPVPYPCATVEAILKAGEES